MVAVRPLAVSVVVPQAIEVKVPQVPLYNCIAGFVKFVPRLLIVTVSVLLAATNEYQTSYNVPAGSQPAGMPVDAVAISKEPAVFEQVALEVSEKAPEQMSLTGGLVTQTE